jgi:hypothetical protein
LARSAIVEDDARRKGLAYSDSRLAGSLAKFNISPGMSRELREPPNCGNGVPVREQQSLDR